MPFTSELLGNLPGILSPLFGGIRRPEEELFNPTQAMNQLYTPETMATDALFQHINSMPRREPPNMLKRIVAAAAGAQGPEAAEQQERIMYGDYGRQMQDWNAKLNPLVQLANFERASNINERALAGNILTQERGYANLARQTARDRVLEEQGSQRLRQGEDRLALAREKFEEELKIQQALAKGGTIDWGSSQIIQKDGTVVPIKGDIFTTQERLALQQKYALERITETAENRPGNRDRITKEVRINPVTGRPELGTYNLDTNTFIPAKEAGTEKPVEPGVRDPAKGELEKLRARNARALSVRVQDPAGKYVQIKNGQFVDITKPGLVFGPTVDEYKRLYRRIFGEEPTEIPQATNVAPTGAQPITPQGTEQRIRVRRTNPQTGKIEEGTIPASQRQQAIAAGYEILK